MIEDVGALKLFLAPGEGSLANVRMADLEYLGLKLQKGHVIVRQGIALPVIRGRTVTSVFGEATPSKYAQILASPLRPSRELSSAVVIPGATNYYHFVVFNLPGLLLLRLARGERITLATVLGFPPSAASLVAKLLPPFSGDRPVDMVTLSEGDYSASNVIFRAKPLMSASVGISRLVQRMVLRAAGIEDAVRDLGAIKLFVRREFSRNGRNLSNQQEVERWFTDRGYVPADPGALTMEDQILLFSRATHIVGVEGAALTNLVFATQAKQFLVLASPNTRGDIFFSELALFAKLPFTTIYGEVAACDVGNRAANYILSRQSLDSRAHITD